MKFTNEKLKRIEDLILQNVPIKQICNEVGCCNETVRKISIKLGIHRFKGMTYPIDFKKCDNDLKQLIIGSLLGDGSFVSAGKACTNYCMSIAHCKEQKDYINYKFKILNKYNLVTKIREQRHIDNRFKEENKNYLCYSIKTRNNPIFTKIRKDCYIDGKKHPNLKYIQDIDALGLAIWYMDDGYITNNSCIFSTCSFPENEQRDLSIFLLGKFGLHFTVGKNDNSMYLKSEDFEKFKSIIQPFILDSFKYKLVPYKHIMGSV